MKIAFINGKGGSGKTTTCILVAMALREAGHAAAVVDLDPQKTATRWLSDQRELLDPEAPIQLLDTPPRLESDDVRQAIAEADSIVVVSRPSPCDLFTSQDTALLLENLGAKGKSKLLFTNVREGTILARGLEQTAEDIGLEAFRVHLQLREAYQHAVLAGWPALNQNAREEVGRVALAIVTMVK